MNIFLHPTRKSLWLGTALLLFCGLRCQAQTAGSGFFLLLADPQMGMFEKDTSSLEESANLDLAIATANRLQPAFVVICGDLVNKHGDPAELKALQASLGKLHPEIPLHLVAGNHDVGNVPTTQTLKEYRERFGPDFYTFQTKDLFSIVLDSSLMGTAGNEQEDADQLAWLGRQLIDAQKKGYGKDSIAIFQHIPFFLASAGEKDQYFNVPAVSRQRYLEVLRQYSVEHVFAGHYHRNAEGTDGSLLMLTTGAVGKPLGQDDSGMRLVHFGARWLNPYFPLGRLPDATFMQQWMNSW